MAKERAIEAAERIFQEKVKVSEAKRDRALNAVHNVDKSTAAQVRKIRERFEAKLGRIQDAIDNVEIPEIPEVLDEGGESEHAARLEAILRAEEEERKAEERKARLEASIPTFTTQAEEEIETHLQRAEERKEQIRKRAHEAHEERVKKARSEHQETLARIEKLVARTEASRTP